MTEYKCFNCGAELRVDGKWLQCDVEDCMSKYPLDRYDDPAVIIVRNCWECPRRFRGGVNACEPLDKEFGAMIGCGPLEDCPLKRLSELKKDLIK